jgi:hypothetical protein
MGRGQTNKEYIEQMQEISRLKNSIIHDRKFLSSFTNDEFIKYESKNYNITEKFIEKTLKEYGFIKTNNSTIIIEGKERILQEYSSRIDDSY